MSAPANRLSCRIAPEMHLDDIFNEFVVRFEHLSTPRSVAEAQITQQEIKALEEWFASQMGHPRSWCESLFQCPLESGGTATRREMYGAMLLILASESCREHATEDAVWPIVTAILRRDKASYPALFVSGQPTALCKSAIVAGTRRLKLRNVIDRDGAQEYFDTLKLQFGFTRGGAERRLGGWLDGLPAPIAVKSLLGQETGYEDLASESFIKLWQTLQDFRRGRLAEKSAVDVLGQSPWVRPEWVPRVLEAAKKNVDRSSAIFEASDSGLQQQPFRMELRWADKDKPRLLLRIDEEHLRDTVGEATKLVFCVDGKITARWVLQEDGQWSGTRALPCELPNAPPNLRPRILTVQSEDRVIEELDLVELGSLEPLRIFDLATGENIGLESPLATSRSYAFLCETDLSVPEAELRLNLRGVVAFLVRSPWAGQLSAVSGDSVYWSYAGLQRERTGPLKVALQIPGSALCDLGSTHTVQVSGIPGDAQSVSLQIDQKSFAMNRFGEQWLSEGPVPLSVQLVTGAASRRVRVIGPAYKRSAIPDVKKLALRGIAFWDADEPEKEEWKLIKQDLAINRASGAGTAKVYWEASDAPVFEGARFVGKVRNRSLPMRDLHGWGAPLYVSSANGVQSTLVNSVEDRGVGMFLPPLFSGLTDARIVWRSPVDVASHHLVHAWVDLAKAPVNLGPKQIQSPDGGRTWVLPNLGSIVAMAICSDGHRLSAWWELAAARESFANKQSKALFALVRWLKLPLLNPKIREMAQRAVHQVPMDLISTWAQDNQLAAGLKHRPGEAGIDTVIREFLWDAWFNETTTETIARSLFGKTPTDGDSFKDALIRFSERFPSLVYQLAAPKLRSEKYRKYAMAVLRAILGQPETSGVEELTRVLSLEAQQCSKILGTSTQALEQDLGRYEAQLANRRQEGIEAGWNIRRLGELNQGRKLISAALLARLVERKTQ